MGREGGRRKAQRGGEGPGVEAGRKSEEEREEEVKQGKK